MSGLNLHQIARCAVTTVHPDESVTLYQASGQTVNADGSVSPAYAAPRAIAAQIQTESDAALYFADRVGMNEQTRRMYLLTPSEWSAQVAGVVRPLARGGDMIRRADGSWWLVTAVLENFAGVNWTSVRATLQEYAPEGVA